MFPEFDVLPAAVVFPPHGGHGRKAGTPTLTQRRERRKAARRARRANRR